MNANFYIMNDCNMKPLARLGANDTNLMTVFTPSQKSIGFYDPEAKTFQAHASWELTWSPELIQATGVREGMFKVIVTYREGWGGDEVEHEFETAKEVRRFTNEESLWESVALITCDALSIKESGSFVFND